MVEIKKVGDGFKRLCAVLVACVVMWYSVITAPVFRVGAIDQGSGIATIGSTLIGGLLGLVSSAEVFNPVVGAALSLATPLIVEQAFTSINPGIAAPLQLPKSIPSNSFAGTYFNSEDPDTPRQLTFYQYSWDYTGFDTSYGVCADTILSCEDYSVGMVVVPDSDWVSSSSRENMSIQLACSSFFGSGVWSISPSVSLSDSSGAYPSAHVTYYVRFSDGQGFFSDRTISGTSVSTPLTFEAWPARYPNYIYTYDRSTFESVFRNASGRFLLAYVYDTTTNRIQSTSYPVLSSPITTSEQAINYYDNSVRPYVINNYSSTYPEYTRQFITYQEYYDSLPADPSVTTPAQTGVIIIDPFTLPPDWVQSDVVELETDHYEVPFESMVADPFDYLVSPYTQTSTETVRGVTKSVPISPPTPQYQVFPSSGNVQETAVGFVNLAYTLLNRSGLDYVIGIAVFGLCVSLLVL